MPDDLNATESTPEGTETDAPQADAKESTLDTEAMRKELEKVRKEAAKYRTRLREREEAEQTAAEEKRKAEQTAEERAKDAEKRAEEALAAAEKRVQTAERKAALAGKVTQPDRVLRLMDNPDEYFDGAEPDVDRITKDFPEYTPKHAGSTPVDGARPRSGKEPPVSIGDAINQHYNFKD